MPYGSYRATLALPGGDLPFGFEIGREAGGAVIYLENGSERVRIDEVDIDGGRIDARMPGFDNRLTAQVDGAKLEGELVLVKRGGSQQRIDFAAERDVAHRFFAKPLSDNADMSGRWAVTFTREDGTRFPAVGEFRQSHAEITGTFLTPTGDHRYLAGEVRDDELFLSAFDGAHAYLYRARLTPTGELTGTFWSGLASKQSFVAKRDPSATLEGAAQSAVRPEAARVSFTFPDLEGNPVSLDDPRFAGKVVVVALAGSWCPNCHDEAAFLAPWYLRNRERGLEVVSLMFEHFGDFARAADATRRFREALGIEYTTLIAGISDKDDAAKKLPQLTDVYAFPTTLFLDRQGRVRHVHTGFAGPATGSHHEKLVDEFDAVLETLLAEAGVAESVGPSGN